MTEREARVQQAMLREAEKVGVDHIIASLVDMLDSMPEDRREYCLRRPTTRELYEEFKARQLRVG